MDESAQVIVVGAGPVGLLVGLRLVKAGIATTVLEKLPYIEDSPRAAVYQPVAVRELDRAGVLEDCRRVGSSSNNIAWRKSNGEIIAQINRDPTPEEPYENLILGQHQLAEVIQQHFQKDADFAKAMFNHKVTAIDQDDAGVTVTAATPDGEKRFHAKYVVGADGAGSFVRSALGIAFDGFTWEKQIVATNVVYPFDKYGYTTGNMIVHPDHFAVIAKLDDNDLWRVSYGEIAGLTMEQLRERLPMKYEALLPGPRPLQYDLKMFSPYRIHQKCSESFRVGRVILAGDAAHLCNPFGGLGLTGGLLDAGALGDCLTAVIKDGASESLLSKYAEVRRQVFLDIINPMTQANIRRLFENDPETCRDTDPFFQRIINSFSSVKDKEKYRGFADLRVDMSKYIQDAMIEASKITQ